MNNYKIGNVIEFKNTSLGEFLIVDTCSQDNSQYVLVVPYQESENTLDIDIDKLILFEIGNDGNTSVIVDENIVTNIINQFLNKKDT